MSNDMQQYAPARSSGCGGWVFGIFATCGVLTLVGLLLCGGLAYWGVRVASQELGKLTQEYQDRGYEQQAGQIVVVSETPKSPTVYVGQMVTVTGEIKEDVAFVAQIVEIKADVYGDVEFKGQMLTIHQNATIHGNLILKTAQNVTIIGNVTGSITGTYQQLNTKNKIYRNGENVPSSFGIPSMPPPTKVEPQSPDDPQFRIDLDEDALKSKLDGTVNEDKDSKDTKD